MRIHRRKLKSSFEVNNYLHNGGVVLGTEIKNIKKLSLLLEAISEEVIDREHFWKANSVNFDIGVEGIHLSEQLDFVNKTLFHCDLNAEGVVPVEKEGCVTDATWTFALLYDTCFFKKLVTRAHPEDDYDVYKAFYEGRFMGWEVKFFQTFDEVEQYIVEHAEYTSFRLFYGTKKVPLKYGYYEGPRVVYSDRMQFYEHNTRFVEAVGLYKLSCENKSVFAVCHSHRELVTAAVNLVRPKYNDFFDSFYEVVIKTRHQEERVVLSGGGCSRYDLVGDEFFNCWRTCKIVSSFMAGEAVNKEDCCADSFFGCPLEKMLSKEGSI